jgi:hypothetical protein
MVMPTKFNEKIVNEIIALCWEGLTNYQIARTLDLHYQTIARWRRQHEKLKERMDRIREEIALNAIEKGLQKRAEGFKEEEITEKYVVIDKYSGKPKEITRRTKYFPPDISAIGMLARKYCPEEYIEKKVEQKDINVKITQRDRALSLEERRKLLEDDSNEGAIEVEYKEVK